MEIERHGVSFRPQRQGELTPEDIGSFQLVVLMVDSCGTVSEKVEIFSVFERTARGLVGHRF